MWDGSKFRGPRYLHWRRFKFLFVPGIKASPHSCGSDGSTNIGLCFYPPPSSEGLIVSHPRGLYGLGSGSGLGFALGLKKRGKHWLGGIELTTEKRSANERLSVTRTKDYRLSERKIIGCANERLSVIAFACRHPRPPPSGILSLSTSY